MKKLLFLFCIIGIQNIYAQNARPIVSNLNLNSNDSMVIVSYDLFDADNDSMEVFLVVHFADSGRLFLSTVEASGDVGRGIMSGTQKTITWRWDTLLVAGLVKVNIYADDHKTQSIQEILAMVDTERMKNDMDSLEGTRHFSAAPQRLAQIKDSINSRFIKDGCQIREQVFQYGAYAAKNIEGLKPGRGRENEYLIIDAHFDCVSNGPGADDNLSAVVAMLEASRILSSVELNRSLRFVGFDLEELGLLGSREYVKNFLPLPRFEKLNGVFNFEMIGYYSSRNNSQTLPSGFNLLFPEAYNQVAVDTFKGNFITNVGNVKSSVLVDEFKNAAAEYVPNLKVVSVKVPANGSIAPDLRRSDHAPFWDAGYQALMLTDGANFRNKNYHTANDVSDSLNFQFMSDVLKATLASVIKISGLSHAGYASDEIFLQHFVGINQKSDLRDIRILPNPSTDQCKVEWPLDFEATEIKVYNSKAELVYWSEIYNKNSHILLTDVYAEGYYFVELISSKEQMRTRFVVKH